MGDGGGAMSGRKAGRREHYVQITRTVYDSYAFRTLPPSALKLWIDMRTNYVGNNNGNISATLSRLRERGWNSSETLANAIRVLLTRGLVRQTRIGKRGSTHTCSLFSFTDAPTSDNAKLGIKGGKATMEFAQWVDGKSFARPEEHGRQKIAASKIDESRSDNQSGTASKVEHRPPQTASKIEASTAVDVLNSSNIH
jgi:hypothetical protein